MMKKLIPVATVIISFLFIMANCQPFVALPEGAEIDLGSNDDGTTTTRLGGGNQLGETPMTFHGELDALEVSAALEFSINRFALGKVDSILWNNEIMQEGNVLNFCNILNGTSSYDLYIIKCEKSGLLNISLEVFYTDGTSDFFEHELMVGEVGDGGGPGGGGGGTDPKTGEELYEQHCANCHNPLAQTDKGGRNAQQIQNAINNNVGGMGALNGLSAEEVQSIANAL